jgi:hypothetical protein
MGLPLAVVPSLPASLNGFPTAGLIDNLSSVR